MGGFAGDCRFFKVPEQLLKKTQKARPCHRTSLLACKGLKYIAPRVMAGWVCKKIWSLLRYRRANLGRRQVLSLTSSHIRCEEVLRRPCSFPLRELRQKLQCIVAEHAVNFRVAETAALDSGSVCADFSKWKIPGQY